VKINLTQGKPPLLLNMAMYTNEKDTANICTISACIAGVTCWECLQKSDVTL